MNGYMGKIGFIDLTTGSIETQNYDFDIATQFIGGHGLGARILYERMKKGADPLGPENILAITTGPLTGTIVPSGARYMAVFKSPLTGGLGDANSGGYLGSALKASGWDAIFISGQASSPKYLLITNDIIELRDASHLWGMDTIQATSALKSEIGISSLRVALIGPASERLSYISGISDDRGRMAARAGGGAVMGSKKLKAIAVSGSLKVPVYDEDRLRGLQRQYVKKIRESQGFPKTLINYGTCGITTGCVTSGATPIKNWKFSGTEHFPNLSNIADPNNLIKHQIKKDGCANCPIQCGGIIKMDEGKYLQTGTYKKPEYETIAGFGPMCMNDDLESIIKLNDMCNRSGLDTISVAGVMAFAMDCYENKILSDRDLDNIKLQWGDSQAMITLLDKIIKREGIGDVLADGVKIAARKIGAGAEKYSVEVGGQEPGFHQSLFLPGRGVGYLCDPTPGRHTAAVPLSRIDAGNVSVSLGPYKEVEFSNVKKYEFTGKGKMYADASCYWQVGACAGLCVFPVMSFGDYPMIEFLNYVTGYDMDVEAVFKTGARIQTLRQCFNIREGIKPSERKLHDRMLKMAAELKGPLAGVSIDIDTMTFEYYAAMGWDEQGHPLEERLAELCLQTLVKRYE